jgi:diguanylate cyclase (GGDEF)-like protein
VSSESTIGLSRRDFAPPPRDRVRAIFSMREEGGIHQTYVVRHRVTRMGRDTDTEYMIPHRSVSRIHAIVRLEEPSHPMGEPRVSIEDQKSKNGTYINGQRITGEANLRNGDRVVLGDVELIYLHRTEEEIEAERRLKSLATMDQLSGLLNRATMEANFEREFRRAARYDRPLSIVMIDIDHFKKVNDSYGHLFGDFVISETGKLLRDFIRSHDIAARYGGEEFSLMLVETPLSGAVNTAERLREKIEAHPFAKEGTSIHLTASLGVSSFEAGRDDTLKQLLRRADQALYNAKREGRNRVRVAAAPHLPPGGASSGVETRPRGPGADEEEQTDASVAGGLLDKAMERRPRRLESTMEISAADVAGADDLPETEAKSD